MLMGDVAIKAVNDIARRRGEAACIPAGSTYKIRGRTTPSGAHGRFPRTCRPVPASSSRRASEDDRRGHRRGAGRGRRLTSQTRRLPHGRVYDTGLTKGRQIQDFSSRGARVTTLVSAKTLHIALLQLAPEGLLGAHKVATDQLLIAVQGNARVSGDDNKPVDIVPGSAAFWNKEERHEIRAGADGMLAVIVEGDQLARSLAMSIRKVTG